MYRRRHDTQHNDIQPNDNRHEGLICDIQHNDTLYKDIKHNVRVSLSWVPFCFGSQFIYSYAECHYGECRYAEGHYAECRYAECHYAECRYAERRYAECGGAL
jgi:hypothetical protein